MKRLVLTGLLFGMVNGLAAALALHLVPGAGPDAAYGWFANAPRNRNVVYDYYGFPWQYIVVPAVLIVLNALLLPLAVRRARLRG